MTHEDVTTVKLEELEEYDTDKFLIKSVYDGGRSKAKLLHLLPGQEVPVHPHPNLEVILVPQKGEAVLTGEDGGDDVVSAGTVSYRGIGPTFGLRNAGTEPFQTLVLLVLAGKEAE